MSVGAMNKMFIDKQRFCQNPAEHQQLLVWAHGMTSFLEIGARYGDDLKSFARLLQGRANRIVVIDKPGAEWGAKGSEKELRENVRSLQKSGYDVHLFIGDSQDPEIIFAVNALGPFDFTFIDGDHRYEGVKADWEVYGPMSKKVAFHDIQKPTSPGNAEMGVYKLWNELNTRPDAQSFIAPGSPMGVGCVGWTNG
jgi:hypothetical protein